MYPFQSMESISIYIAITVCIVLVVIVQMNPLKVAFQFMKYLVRRKMFLSHLVLVIAILYVNKLELLVENSMQLSYDLTPFVYSIEGSVSTILQHMWQSPILTFFFTYLYTVMLPTLLIGSIFIYSYKQDHTMYYAACYAITINYLVAIPFYLFFPVDEVWYFLQPDAKLLIVDAFPTFEQEYRPFSGLDNCFPSLHTSLSITMAFLAYRSSFKAWGYFAIITASLIVISIFYLGIHWISDMLAGCLLGYGAARIGYWLANTKFPLGRTH
jgi:membrane-associated phospholipid phosphatase